MRIIKTDFKGLYIIKPVVFEDIRGYFYETFNMRELEKEGISFNSVQDNESKSRRGVIRGLHYQLNPYAQAKLIRVAEGKIFDVALDIRKNSPTFGKWFGIELDSETREQVLIPEGFAHGFSVLSETAVIQYKCNNYYNLQAERGISASDPGIGIDWKLGDLTPVISVKDLQHPSFKNAEYNF